MNNQPNSKGRPENQPFAEALRQAMTNGNLSASEVARRIWGTTKDSRGYDVARNRDRIGHYLAAASYPEPENLELLAKAVGVPVETLAIDRPKPTSTTTLARGGSQSDRVHVTFYIGKPTRARLQMDRILSMELAMKIVALADAEETRHDEATESHKAAAAPSNGTHAPPKQP